MSEQKKLTVADPVSPEVLESLSKLESAHMYLASRLADMELEKVKLLVRLQSVLTEKNRIFEREAVERGISPTTMFQIDDETGIISISQPEDNKAAQPEVS